nr:MAG TPA: hypothetical protein [Microviridae sp.]
MLTVNEQSEANHQHLRIHLSCNALGSLRSIRCRSFGILRHA